MHFLIDVVGTCNLKCPSCPVGNSREIKTPKGIMRPEKLRAILMKAMNECQVDYVSLYNWTEPLINPHLPELIKVVKELGLKCGLSSNLNVLKNEDALMASNPDALRISMSGYTQENYGITHRGGNVSKVLENIGRLVAARSRTKATTDITIYFHRYLTNIDDEFQLREFAAKIGISFKPGWAYFQPLEKMLSMAYNDSRYSTVNSEDLELIKKLSLPINEAISIGQRHQHQPCSLLEDQIVIDVNGEVTLCCTIYDTSNYRLGNYLERPLKDITKDKHESTACRDLCKDCTKKGLHVIMTNASPEFAEASARNVLRNYKNILAVEKTPHSRLIFSLAKYAPKMLAFARRMKRKIA